MHRILRVVIDTNHIISAILSGRGASAKLIDWMTRDEDYFQLLLSEPIWQEYKTVAEWLVPRSRHREDIGPGNFFACQGARLTLLISFEFCAIMVTKF